MVGVSTLDSRPSSCSTLAMIPDDETYVMPPNAAATTGGQPRIRPAIAPGEKLRTKSMTPPRTPVRRLFVSSLPVYSRPSMKSSSTTPISAPTCTKSWLNASGSRPPLPNANPASR